MIHGKKNDITHFGFTTVTKSQKTEMVANVFHSVASKYDLMNDLMSFGIHRIWKYVTIQCSGIRRGQKVLDLAGGTGDMASKLSTLVGKNGQVILADINDTMLKIGRAKLRDQGILENVSYIKTNAEALSFSNETFDCIIISFGLRNVTNKERALQSMYRVLKPGGRALILEFSTPCFKLLKKTYDLYSFYILPRIGKIVTNDSKNYRYLVESIRMHPDQETMKSMILSSGFNNVEYFNMTGGIVALHLGYKF